MTSKLAILAILLLSAGITWQVALFSLLGFLHFKQYIKIAIIAPNTTTEATTIPAYVTALVFYNVELTASQHAELYENIKALGGGID